MVRLQAEPHHSAPVDWTPFITNEKQKTREGKKKRLTLFLLYKYICIFIFIYLFIYCKSEYTSVCVFFFFNGPSEKKKERGVKSRELKRWKNGEKKEEVPSLIFKADSVDIAALTRLLRS